MLEVLTGDHGLQTYVASLPPLKVDMSRSDGWVTQQ